MGCNPNPFPYFICNLENTFQGMGTLGPPSLRNKIDTLWNKHEGHVMKKAHAPTKANNCIKMNRIHEILWAIEMDRHTDATGHNSTLRPKWDEGKIWCWI